MNKLELNDSMLDIVTKMSEGNPGAIECIMQMLTKADWHGGVHGMMMILPLDTMGIYGSQLYMLWNDCCDRDLTQMEVVLRNWQMGELSREEIIKNISSGRGRPFENLKPLSELFAS